MNNLLNMKSIALLSLLLLNYTLSAKVILSKMFTDNMVLQQQTEVPIWGSSNQAEVTVKTSWDNKSYVVSTNDTQWKVIVKTPQAGGPYSILISDDEEIILSNVLIGEVWICSGQSNMEMPLAGWGQVENYIEEIGNANYPNIRLFHVNRATSTSPLNELKDVRNGGWEICSPTTIADFSSTAYFFARKLNQELNVPIGLISASWGGTVAEAWTSGRTLKNMPYFEEIADLMMKYTEEELQQDFNEKYSEWCDYIKSIDMGYDNGMPKCAVPEFDDSTWSEMSIQVVWEEQTLPEFDGIVWYRRVIDIPIQWKNNDLTLLLPPMDDTDITYFNGVEIGQTSGFTTPRRYTIPANLIQIGKNVIASRVTDTGGGGGIYGDYPASIGCANKKSKKIDLSGNWKYSVTVDFNKTKKAPIGVVGNPNRASALFNAMIHPIIPYSIKGAIWYQGESNSDRAEQYRDLFSLLIRDWRSWWGYDFDFHFVQLASFMKESVQPEESDWAKLREAQAVALKVNNTGMAVTTDIGDALDIHPKNKQEVGRRLALNALNKTYGKDVAFSGPIFSDYQVVGNTIIIVFENVDGGLEIKDSDQLSGFAIAGTDRKFYWADAIIDGDKVIVKSEKVPFPVSVRYGWANNPICNLSNKSKLPAAPFRTDDW